MLKKSLGLALAAGILAATAAQAKIIDLMTIAGRTPAEVARVLGRPTKIEKVKPFGTGCNPCDKVYYKGGMFEIVYIRGRADWITIKNLKGVPMNKYALPHFGLPIKDPTQGNENIEWTNFSSLVKIVLFSYQGKADYLYVKVNTR